MKRERFFQPKKSLVKFAFAASACVAAAFLCVAQDDRRANDGRPTVPAVTNIANFENGDGNGPIGNLVQGADGNLYGTTGAGGASGDGTVFKVTPSGKITSLHSFTGSDGSDPQAGLALGTDGNFYGTTEDGGAFGWGTIFKITPGGELTTLHSFNQYDGFFPEAVIEATDGNFYGTTWSSYTGSDGNNYGTVFKITSGGAFTTLFYMSPSEGEYPSGGLVQGSDGNLYGTAANAGVNDGAAFEATTKGLITAEYDFTGSDGSDPAGRLVQASDGNFYGTTAAGGDNGLGEVFKIDPTLLSLTVLHSFAGSDGGKYPNGGLIQGTDGNLYGTTPGWDGGTIFDITSSGTLTILYTFLTTNEGAYPYSGVVQHTNGNFYGVTSAGGTVQAGTVYSLSMGLGPFVRLLPTSGKVGSAVHILGTNLTDITSVTFNGKAATFKPGTDTSFTATVPAGATTGTVKVVNSGGTLVSNVRFTVP